MNAKLSRIFSHPVTIPVSIGLLSFGAGVGVGYILGIKDVFRSSDPHELPEQLEFDYVAVEEFIMKHDAEVKHDANVKKDKEVDVDQVSRDFIAKKLQEDMTTTVDSVEPVAQNIFAGSDDEWDYDEEVKTRSSQEPYVIHRDEFYADELGYTQTTLTFYAGDDIMVDEEDSPVYNHASVTGPMRFGHGSGDPNVFHVRNDQRKAEYEILYDSGLYSKEVLGLEIEDNQRVKDIKHSSSVRRFRQDD